jgi:hypothetical protein
MLQDTGFSFVNCKVTGSGALYLGRAWGPFSRVIFAYTYMDNIIIPKGWYNWGDPNREMYVIFFPTSFFISIQMCYTLGFFYTISRKGFPAVIYLDHSINNRRLRLVILNFIIFNLNRPICGRRMRSTTATNCAFLLLQAIQILSII